MSPIGNRQILPVFCGNFLLQEKTFPFLTDNFDKIPLSSSLFLPNDNRYHFCFFLEEQPMTSFSFLVY